MDAVVRGMIASGGSDGVNMTMEPAKIVSVLRA
jgi:hypothetical protein